MKVSVEEAPRDLSYSKLIPGDKSHAFKGTQMACSDLHLQCSLIPLTSITMVSIMS